MLLTNYIWLAGIIILLLVIFIREKKYFLSKKQHKYTRNELYKLKLLINRTTDWVWEMDNNGCFTFCNEAVEDITGYHPLETIGKQLIDFVPSWEKAIISKKYHELLEMHMPFTRFECVFETKRKNIIYLEANGIPLFENNQLMGYRGIIRNVTSHKLNLEKLKTEQQRLKLALSSAEMGIWEWKTGTNTFYLSPEFYNLMHYRPFEFNPDIDRVKAAIHKDDIANAESRLRRFFLSKKDVFEIEFRLADKHGDYIWLLCRGMVNEREPDKSPRELMGVVVNINQRKKSEEILQNYNKDLEELINHRTDSLQRSNEKLKHEILLREQVQQQLLESELFLSELIDYFPDPLFVVNSKQTIVQYNKSFEMLFLPKEFKKGDTYFEVFDKKVAKELSSGDNELLFRQAVAEREVVLNTKTAKNCTFALKKSSFVDTHDDTIIINVLKDITSKKIAEQEITKTLQLEKDLNALRTQFITTVSHEFRTPLTGIMNITQLLKKFDEKWDTGKRTEKYAQIIYLVSSLKAMLDDISMIGKEMSGKLGYNPQKVDLTDLINKVLKELEAVFTKNVAIEATLNGLSGPYTLDGTLIRQILINLISNAINYSPANTVVRLNVSALENILLFEVVDKGIGIPPQDVEKIFLPFYRAANVKDMNGTGLGMTVVKKYVEIHNGEIKVMSNLNKGTTVQFTIPIIDNHQNI